jgi:AcrR family transcriptional regulator
LSTKLAFVTTSDSATKPLRADARRNYEALIASGRRVFVRSGIDAPMDDVAKDAGVGRGTLYRHFPSREHLFVAILKDRIDELAARAHALRVAPQAWRALTEWLRLYDRIAAEYRGMSTRLADGLADESSPVAAACAPMKAGFDELFEHARREGVVRSDVTAVEVLSLISALPKQPATGATADIHLDIAFHGLRP